jgi:hypothetical protein
MLRSVAPILALFTLVATANAQRREGRPTADTGALAALHFRSTDARRTWQHVGLDAYERISWMIGPMVGRPGSGSSGGDVGPTAQQVAVNDGFKQELAAIAAEFKRLVDVDAPAFSGLLKQNGIASAVVP